MKSGYIVCACLLLTMLLPWFGFSRQPDKYYTETEPTLAQTEAPAMPATKTFCIPETPVVLWDMGDYEGEFLENNSDEPVLCASLVLENTGTTMLEYVRIRLDEMIFEGTCIPPGAKALILEKNRHRFAPKALTAAVCEAITYSKPTAQNAVYVSEAAPCDLIVTNLTDRTLPCVQIRYKQFSSEAELYWGGITYTIEITELQAGESRRITPYRFVVSGGKIIDISVNN